MTVLRVSTARAVRIALPVIAAAAALAFLLSRATSDVPVSTGAAGYAAERPADAAAEMTLEEASDAWLAGEGPAPGNGNPAPLLPEDQRSAWIESFRKTTDCMRRAGFSSFPDAPATFGDGRTQSPLIVVPSDPAEGDAFTAAFLGDCALDTSQLDIDIFEAAMEAATEVDDERSDLQREFEEATDKKKNAG